MVYSDLLQIQQLPTYAVRHLGIHGDPRERVWAAWTLGLNDAQAPAWIAERARIDPVPGVRRHLVVMLAGYRRTDELWALSVDPDARVRGTALHWLCRLSPPHDMVAWDRIMPRLVGEPADVRAAIIRGLPAELPDAVQARWPALIEDPSRDVRAAVLARIRSFEAPCPSLIAAVRARLSRENDRSLRCAMQRWLGVPPSAPAPSRGSPYPLMRLG